MPDTMRSDFPDKYCANCGKKDCYIKHWGGLMNYEVVYLDECISSIKEGTSPRYNCNTGEVLENVQESSTN